MVTIRLTRRGSKNNPAYCIVVADSRAKRDGKFLEKLGCYDPTTKTTVLSQERAEVRKKQGATLSEAVKRILKTRTSYQTEP